MITRRDVLAAAVSAGVTLSAVAAWSSISAAAAAAPGSQPILQSALLDWKAIQANRTGVGEVRQFVRSRTVTLDELEVHATSLNPGESSHPPHHHPNEELVILQTGTLEATSNGQTQRLGPGSVIFNASNQWHTVRNVGEVPATYHVVNWTSPGKATKKEPDAPPAPKQP
jgi:XRE family transcriptional regulator, regulator of sulfur utilization